MSIAVRAAVIAVLLCTTPQAYAQTQAQQDRLNRVAQFVVTAPMCEKLGMTLATDLPRKAEAAFRAETATWTVDAARLDRLKGQATARQDAILKTDLEAAANGAKTEAQLRAVKGILLGYGRTCMAATTDPLFSALIVPPPGYDLDRATTEVADSLLQGGGLASWQTPQIQARGDLMMIAGTCRSKIGAARSDALVKAFGQSDDPRVRDYYSRAFDEGLSDPSTIPTLAGCDRAIANYRAMIR